MVKIKPGKSTLAFLFILFIFLYLDSPASIADVLNIPEETETSGTVENSEATDGESQEALSKESETEETTTEAYQITEEAQPLVATAEAPKQEETKAEAPIEKRYVVKEGDTLWDIAENFMKDPFLWPKLWKDNKFIINPDLIYPGNVVIIRGDEIIVVAKPKEIEEPVVEEVVTPPPVSIVEETVPVEPPKPVEVVLPPSAKVDPLSILAAGYITKGEPEVGTIAGSWNNKELLGEGDIIYIIPKRKRDLPVGEKYVVYRNARKVIHPKTGKHLGNLIKVLGVIEVSEYNGKISTARVFSSFDYMTSGDHIMAYEQAISAISESLEEEEGSISKSSAALKGYIVDVKDDKVANAQSDIVYIDKGLIDGVHINDSFIVLQEGSIVPPSFSLTKGTSFPDQVVAELQIINVRDKTATAKVTKSLKTIERGNLIKTKISE